MSKVDACCGEYVAGTRCPACPDRDAVEVTQEDRDASIRFMWSTRTGMTNEHLDILCQAFARVREDERAKVDAILRDGAAHMNRLIIALTEYDAGNWTDWIVPARKWKDAIEAGQHREGE